MATETLEFEESLVPLLKEVDALSALPRTEARERELERLNQKLRHARSEIYAKLTPWQRVLVARHPSRPDMLHYVVRLFTDFVELHGDRRFADDHAIVAGRRATRGSRSWWLATTKAATRSRRSIRNFGYARPEGYRKAIRLMRLAEKFHRPIVVFVDTPAAYPGVESEERGVAEAIAFNLREMSVLKVPIVVIITGEGGSGGALGIADRRSDPDAGACDLQRHPARGLRGDLMARRSEEGGGGQGAQADGAGSASERHHRRDRARADRRRSYECG